MALPASLPVELIGHRADVVANRWRVLEADKGIAAAHADFYPDINLLATASLGSAATFGGFFNFINSDGVGHGVGAAISLPILDGGRRRGNYGVAVTSRDAAVDQYNESVVNAMRAVAQQVVSLRSLDQQQASVEHTQFGAQIVPARRHRLSQRHYRISQRAGGAERTVAAGGKPCVDPGKTARCMGAPDEGAGRRFRADAG